MKLATLVLVYSNLNSSKTKIHLFLFEVTKININLLHRLTMQKEVFLFNTLIINRFRQSFLSFRAAFAANARNSMMLRQTWLLLPLGALLSCHDAPPREAGTIDAAGDSTTLVIVDEIDEEAEETWIFRRNGKIRNAPFFENIFQQTPLDTFDFPFISSQLIAALEKQEKLLELVRQKQSHRIGNLTVTIDQLEETIRILKQWQQTKPLFISQYLEAHQLWGEDRQGNVLFTGYFTPIVQVSKNRSGAFRHPIYDRPIDWEGPLPTRRQIEGERLFDGLGLELAYAQNKVDVYYMQLQGSGFVEYPDGGREFFAYNGTNRHPYRSIEQYLMAREDLDISTYSIAAIRRFLQNKPLLTDTVLFHNPSYVFFRPQKTQPKGAGLVPLTGDFSIAVDKRYIPLGSVLLAAYPVYNRQTRNIEHAYRIMLAQDVGGAIRGPGHVDVYTGVGAEAQRKASYLKHYGRLWLLLPKPNPAVSLSNLQSN